MAKDILVLGRLSEYNALYFYQQIKEAQEEDAAVELNMHLNSEGGSPEYAMSIIQKVQALADKMSIECGAMVHSMALFFLCYVPKERVTCIDVTKGILHRAASWMEDYDFFPNSIQATLMASVNKDLEKALRARIDVEVLEALPQFVDKNLKLKDIFSMDARHEVMLTGADLKKIGLVGTVNKVTPAKSAKITALTEAFNKCSSLSEYKTAANAAATPPTQNENQNTIMKTIEELRIAYPALVASIEADAKKAGITAERERVEGILVFAELDMAACKTAIESGKDLTAKQRNEFALKAMNPAALTAAAGDAAKVLKVGESATVVKTEAEIKNEAFLAETAKNLPKNTAAAK